MFASWVDYDEWAVQPYDPMWCGGCGSPADPCECGRHASEAVDDLGVPFRAPDPVLHAGLLDSLLDNEAIDR